MAEAESNRSEAGGSPRLDRRTFIRRTVAVSAVATAGPMVTSFALPAAIASPCGSALVQQAASKEEPEASTAAQPPARDPNEPRPPEQAFGGRSHSPCYQRCMEQRAGAEIRAIAAFESCMSAAGTDEARRAQCSTNLRTEQARFTTDFRACITPCNE